MCEHSTIDVYSVLMNVVFFKPLYSVNDRVY